MFCSNCGYEMEENDRFCANCGAENMMHVNREEQLGNSKTQSEDRCLAAFIIGLIGSIMGIFGGFCTTMCASLAMVESGFFALILIFGGSIVGMVGACQCLKNVKRGSILQLIGAALIIICAYGITGAEFMSILAFLLLLAGGIVGLVDHYVIKKR